MTQLVRNTLKLLYITIKYLCKGASGCCLVVLKVDFVRPVINNDVCVRNNIIFRWK